ncbi:csdA Selenocysteine lyase/Cysteine desulfurase [Burkholderiaceae bacterium]
MTTIEDARLFFPGSDGCIYLENSARGLLPSTARDAALRYYDARIAGVAKETDPVFDAERQACDSFATLVGATPNEITLTRNVTDGLNIFVTALPWKAGDNAVVSKEVEHPNGVYALYNMRQRHGIEVRMVDAGPDLSISVDAIAHAIDAHTRLVIVSSVTFSTGARTDLAALGQLCQSRGVTLLVDGAQSVGAIDINVHALNIDGLVVGASKYLCGPYGLGFLYIRRALADSLHPTYLGRYSIDLGNAHEGDQGGNTYQLMPGAKRFDSGSYNYSAASAAVASINLLKEITVPVIEQHVLRLAKLLDDGLRAIGLPILSGGNERHRSQLVLMGLREPTTEQRQLFVSLADFFTTKNIRVSQRQGRLRFSFHLYNTGEDVKTVLAAAQEWMQSQHISATHFK